MPFPWYIGPALALAIRALFPKRGKVKEIVITPKMRTEIEFPEPIRTKGGRFQYTKNRAEFIKYFGPLLNAMESRYGFAKNILVAQAGKETGWGQYVIDKNLFNIKSTPKWTGKSILPDGSPASKEDIKALRAYRAYGSFIAAIENYMSLIYHNYKEAWNNRNNPAAYFNALLKGGYVGKTKIEDPAYAIELTKIHREISIL